MDMSAYYDSCTLSHIEQNKQLQLNACFLFAWLQLTRKLAAVEKDLTRLASLADAIRSRIQDKTTTENIERHCLMMDGRSEPEVPRPASTLTVSASHQPCVVTRGSHALRRRQLLMVSFLYLFSNLF